MTEPRPRPLWVHLVWVAIAAAIGHRLSLVFFDADSGISAAWPASGLWLALLLRSERQRWPWIIATIGLVSLIADMLLVKSLAVSLGYVGSNVLEMSLGAWVMTRVAGENIDFRRLRHVLALLLVVSLVNGLATLPGAWAGAQFGTAGFWAAARTWWTADALGLLVVTPALVAWSSPRATMPEKGLEACAFLVLWTVASVLTFTSTATFVYPYQLICLLAFPALRYGTGVVALALTLLGGIALVAAFQSPSFPFDGAQIFERVTQAQLFLLVSAATALILVASTEERRSAAAEIESGEQLLSLAMNAAGLGAWRYDVASNKVAWSSEVEKIFGLAPGTFDGRFETYISLLHPADRQRVVDTVAKARETGEDYEVEHRVLLVNGEERFIAGHGRVVKDAAGRTTALIGTVSDITRRKRVDEVLRQAQKMDAIGHLAGGIAHDFNNLLGVILLELEAAKLAGDAKASTASLESIRQATERAAGLTQQLLAFGRRQVMQARAVDVNEQVTALGKMLARIVGEPVTLELKLSPGKLVAQVDAGMVDQLVMNLVVNACDAMPLGGKVTIETRRVESLDVASLSMRHGEPHVCIRVSDTGTGIAEEHRARIFEPFFTTKPAGKGTGLGLATVFGIVKQHQGHLAFESEPGKGTTFEIFLPVGTPVAQAAKAAAAPGVEAPGGETILLVEDETALRRITAMLLKRKGYQVIDVGNGAEAVAAVKAASGEIHLLLTDVMLPGGVTGVELAATLGIQRVIFTSGYSAELAGKALEASDLKWFLQKPTEPSVLFDTIQRCLRAEVVVSPTAMAERSDP